MITLEGEVTELIEESKYSNNDKAMRFVGRDGRLISLYYLYGGGYISYYETRKDSNTWEVHVNMPNRNKEDYALAQSRIIRLLPSGHKVIPGETITNDGIRNWHKQVLRDYEYANEFCYPYKLPGVTEEDKPVRIKLPILKYKK